MPSVWVARVLTAGALVVASPAVVPAAGASATPRTGAALSGPHVFGWGFSFPASATVTGAHVWVANVDSVTELNAAAGAVVRVITKPGFSEPGGISSDGSHVWVTSNNTVIELNAATGAEERVLSGPKYLFDDPVGVSSDGADVWVANNDGNSVTGFPAG